MLRSFCGVLLAFVLALALAQDAGAKARTIVYPGGLSSEFELRGSNGYRLEVSSGGGETEVTASGGIGKGFVTYAVASRKHGKRGFEAKLPGIGRIAVDFRPRGKARKVPVLEKVCTGKPGREEAGTFVGTINFHGEGGYTEATATRVKGKVLRTYPETCPVEKKGGGGSGMGIDEGPYLTAAALAQGLIFTAGRFNFGDELGGEISGYTAAQLSNSRGMEIMRILTAIGRPESFSAEHTGRTASARVEPPPPFSGTADFGIAPDGTVNWTGDLSVTLPGTGPIRLAGKRFVAKLCVRDRCAGDASSSAAPTPRPWPR
jgi:hypothetical protein